MASHADQTRIALRHPLVPRRDVMGVFTHPVRQHLHALSEAVTTWFHADTSASRGDFSDQRWAREKSLDPNQEGPGLYFTSEEKDASRYGGHLYSATLSKSFRRMPKKPAPTRFLHSMYAQASAEDKELFLSNWGHETESPQAIADALSSYQNMTVHEAAVSLYGDMIRDANMWVRAVVKSGYDGVTLKRKGVQHLVVWNPKKMTITKVR